MRRIMAFYISFIFIQVGGMHVFFKKQKEEQKVIIVIIIVIIIMASIGIGNISITK